MEMHEQMEVILGKHGQPEPDEQGYKAIMLTVECAFCGERFKVPAELGSETVCPFCGEHLTIV